MRTSGLLALSGFRKELEQSSHDSIGTNMHGSFSVRMPVQFNNEEHFNLFFFARGVDV